MRLVDWVRNRQSPTKWVILCKAVLKKQFTIMLRYRVNFAINIVTMYVLFAIVFFGGQAAVSQAGGSFNSLDSTLNGLIVGWFLWTMSQGAYSGLASNVTQESEWGTLEQLFMSPFGFGGVMWVKAIVNLVQSTVVGGIMLLLMMVTTGRILTVDLVTIGPILVLTIFTIIGFGFAFGGLALIYKRVQSVSNIMQFAMVGLISAPVADISWLRALPLVQGSGMLQASMRRGVRLWEFAPPKLVVLVVTAIVYPLVGYVIFSYCSSVARRRGVMGHY
ncbi:ABC transporter permease [Halomicroarcula salina]|uniref:ABC transporter permease n=2 Tax=Haloarcula salina TaxID=1429914 RepID=A0AA41KGU8_9EURY|nr:ABC transporter permease [Haloarcula salina]